MDLLKEQHRRQVWPGLLAAFIETPRALDIPQVAAFKAQLVQLKSLEVQRRGY